MLLRRVECWTECFVDPESVDNSASLYAVHPYCIGATCPRLVIATSKVQSNANCSTLWSDCHPFIEQSYRHKGSAEGH